MGCWFEISLLRRLAALARRTPEEFGRIDLQHDRQFLDDLETDVGDRTLDPAQIGAIDPGIMCQGLLRQLLLMAYTTKVQGKQLAQVHDPANQGVVYQPTALKPQTRIARVAVQHLTAGVGYSVVKEG